MNNDQTGGNILPSLVNLGIPIGLSIIAASINIDSDENSNLDNKQKGGDILSNNLLLEFGLSIVPFGLINLLDSNETKSDKSNIKPKHSPIK